MENENIPSSGVTGSGNRLGVLGWLLGGLFVLAAAVAVSFSIKRSKQAGSQRAEILRKAREAKEAKRLAADSESETVESAE